MSIFVNQSLLTFRLDTNFDISAGSEFKVLYQKPNGVKGEWAGVLSGTQIVEYDVQAGDLDIAGTWRMQAYAKIGAKEGYGNMVYFTVEPNLD